MQYFYMYENENISVNTVFLHVREWQYLREYSIFDYILAL